MRQNSKSRGVPAVTNWQPTPYGILSVIGRRLAAYSAAMSIMAD